MDNDDLFSYSNEDKDMQEPDVSSDSLDLNSFSSGAAEEVRTKNKKKVKTKERVLKTVLTVFLVGIITVSIVAGTFLVYAFTMVDGTMDEDLDNLALNLTTTVYVEKDGQWVEYQRLHGEFNRIWVSYDRNAANSDDDSYKGIPQNLVNAFVAIEDKRFYSHEGIDWKRTVSAFINLLGGSKSYGGSTITQQLVKNLTSDNSKRVSRKVREIMRARYLESHYSKDTIIECYLNTIAMDHGIYGVEVASNYYFNKNVNELTIAECATLAAITKSPSYYSPDDNPENNKSRRETVLYEMNDQGYITDEELEAALAEEINVVASREVLKENTVNNYFIDALIRQVTNDIAEKYDYEPKHAAANFYNGGYRIYSTLDPDIQSTVDEVFSNSKAYGLKSGDGQQLQGSITVMDYEGRVRGLAGGIGEKTVNLGLSGFNRATDAIRQPGSTMKPISAYAPAIENGLITYSSIVNDTATNYNGWTPVNWYKSYWGNITVQYALERSVNTIPVYLVNKLGPQTSYDFLTQKLGITTLTSEDINLSPLGMGGTNGGLTTMESAAAFSIFGNGGLYYKPNLYYKVLDQRDNVILSNEETSPVVAVSEDTATVMNHLLQTVVYGSQGTGAGAASTVSNMKIYAKTGTSNNSNDLWFVGGTPYYVASCWCGYDNQTKISSSSIALNMWKAVMAKVHSKLPAKEFTDSSYSVQRYYCTSTGQLATEACPSTAIGWYKKSNIPPACKSHTGTVLDAPGVTQQDADGVSSSDTVSQDSN